MAPCLLYSGVEQRRIPMSYDTRKLCVMCAWRGTCQLKYSMPGGVALHCVEYTRDVTLKEPEEEPEVRNESVGGGKGA